VRFSGLDGVTFDCWGTLIFDRPSPVDGASAMGLRTEAVARICEVDLQRAGELLTEAWTRHFERWNATESYGSPGMARYCLDAVGLDGEARHAELTEAFEEASESNGVDVVPGAGDALADVRRRGMRTALVCDTGFSPGRVVRRILSDKGMAELLDFFAFSDEVGVPKPHERMFRRALDGIGIDPAGAVHVGDLRRTDVAGARAIGMGSVRFSGVYDDTSEHADADVVISAMSELGSLLEPRPNGRARDTS
jgi:putative hydrolase of the HAD superfamily